MKAKIKKTGEIVDVYFAAQHGTSKMIYAESVWVNARRWTEDELELILNDEDVKHWQDVKERAAIAALQGLLANSVSFYNNGTMREDIASKAMFCAHQLMIKLKKEYEE